MPSKIKFTEDTIAIFIPIGYVTGEPVTYAVSVPALVYGDYAITPDIVGADCQFEFGDYYCVTHIPSTMVMFQFRRQGQARKYIENLVELLAANPDASIVASKEAGSFVDSKEWKHWKPNAKFCELQYQA